MIDLRFLRVLSCIGILLIIVACRLPTELKPTFSTSNEILVFDGELNLVKRYSGLPGLPIDLEVFPDGKVVAAVDGAGLALIDPDKQAISAFFGPIDVSDVDITAGKTIDGRQPIYAIVCERHDTVQFLDAAGSTLFSKSVPVGTRSLNVLDNGNLVLANTTYNKIAELSASGETIWESTVDLRQPFDVVYTPDDTFLIADFDRLRVIEINRENKILREGRGFDHPRRLQLLPDGNVIVADSDRRRVAGMATPNVVFPIVEGLNRTHSVAYDSTHRLLYVGVQPHFRPTPKEMLSNPSNVRTWFASIGAGGSILLIAVFFVRKRIADGTRKNGERIRAILCGLQEKRHQSITAVSIAICVVACYLWAVQHLKWGFVAVAVGVPLAVIVRCRDAHWFPGAAKIRESLSDDENSCNRFVRRPLLLVVGLLIVWWAFLWAHLQPLNFWPLLPWFIGPWLCVMSFTKRSEEKHADFLWIIAILIVAAGFRFYRIHDIPYGLWLDETFSFWLSQLEFENQSLTPFHATPLFETSSFDVPNLYLVMLLFASKCFGASFLLVKCFSIIPSLGIVLGVYYLGKWSWSVWAGRMGALLLAVNAWQVTFARWGWLQQWYVFAAVFALAFFARSIRWKCPRSAALTGICLGFGFYTYVPIVLTTAAVALLFLFVIFESDRKTYAKLALLCALHLFLVFASLLDFYHSSPGIFFSRAKTVSIQSEIFESKSLDPLKDNIVKYGSMLHVQGDYNPRHNIPNKPLLDPVTGALFLIGLALVLIRFYRPSERMILLVMAVAITGGILSSAREAPNSFRTGVFGPLVCLTAGLPLASMLDVRRRNIDGGKKKHWVNAFSLLVAIVITGLNGYRYFTQFPSPGTWVGSFGQVQHRIYRELTPEEVGYERLFVHPQFINLTFNVYTFFLESQLNPKTASVLHTRYKPTDIKKEIPQFTPQGAIFVMPPDYLDFMKENIPEIEVRILENPYGEPLAAFGCINQRS